VQLQETVNNDRLSLIEESAERADVAENQLGKLRAKNRSTVSVDRSGGASVSCFAFKNSSVFRFFF
jgi:hypothetical protein